MSVVFLQQGVGGFESGISEEVPLRHLPNLHGSVFHVRRYYNRLSLKHRSLKDRYLRIKESLENDPTKEPAASQGQPYRTNVWGPRV